MIATKGFHHGHFPRRTRQRIDANAAKPSCPNGSGFGFEEGHVHLGHRGIGAATRPAVGHEWQSGHSGQHKGLVCLPVGRIAFVVRLDVLLDSVLGVDAQLCLLITFRLNVRSRQQAWIKFVFGNFLGNMRVD